MRYVLARIDKENREESYRIYITDSLYQQAQGMRLTSRYYDLMNPVPEDKRTGDEIAADVIKKCGLNIK